MSAVFIGCSSISVDRNLLGPDNVYIYLIEFYCIKLSILISVPGKKIEDDKFNRILFKKKIPKVVLEAKDL